MTVKANRNPEWFFLLSTPRKNESHDSLVYRTDTFSDFILSLNYNYLHARSPNYCILPHEPFFKLVCWRVAFVRLSWITIHTPGFIDLKKKKTVRNTFFSSASFSCDFFCFSRVIGVDCGMMKTSTNKSRISIVSLTATINPFTRTVTRQWIHKKKIKFLLFKS